MHIVSLALGGCLKAEPVRYGITEDTGGHITYILGEMEALSRRTDVRLAEIITRRFEDPSLGLVHAQAQEWVNPKLLITRIDSGNSDYLSKDSLSADRAAFAKALIADLEGRERLPDLIHAHFADAAEIAITVEKALGIPFIYTAHSLGMDKQQAMSGNCPAIAARIAEEDRAIDRAQAVVGSSRDECERQLTAYPSARIGKIHRLVPGIKLARADTDLSSAKQLLEPFLRDPTKPIMLAIARPVHKKNLARLVEAFGMSRDLRDRCNLVILAGLREDLNEGEQEQRDVLAGLVDAIDRHDLYGSVAYPKSHTRAQVRALYALAAKTRGVFVNPALMEPYGLTLVEAAAHGLPVVATKVGGPQDIVGELEHGLLIDPEDTGEIATAIERIVFDHKMWEGFSNSGKANSTAMTWERYADGLVSIATDILEPVSRSVAPDYLLVSDLDNTLTGCRAGVARFAGFLKRQGEFAMVIATGRSIVEARRLVREWELPIPRAWITSVGTEIYISRGSELVLDRSFADKIDADWDVSAVDEVLSGIAGLVPQASYEQRQFKRSFFVEDARLATEVDRALANAGVSARVIFSHERLLDILPVNAGKAAAMRHIASALDIPARHVFAAGDSGNDIDMLSACENAILVNNHEAQVASLARRPNVYVSRRSNASGTMEGVLAHRRAQQVRQRQVDEATV